MEITLDVENVVMPFIQTLNYLDNIYKGNKMETCSYCGNKSELGSLDPIRDIFYPGVYNYQCKKCGNYNRVHSRKSFTNPIFLKTFNPKPYPTEITLKPVIIRNELENDLRPITSSNMLQSSPFLGMLKQLEKQNKNVLEANAMRVMDRPLNRGIEKRHSIARSWGSTRIHCTHPTIITKNGITYCAACGQNLKDTKLEKLGIHDPSIPEFGPLDRTLDDIFAQEPNMLELQENRGRGRPRRNPFMYSEELLPEQPILRQSSLSEMKPVSLRTEKYVNDAMKNFFG